MNTIAPKGKAAAWLLEHVEHEGDDCLPWPFNRDSANGYGRVGYNGKLYWAHRLMCEFVHGPAPTSAHQASHSCGKGHRGCVNPRHLSWQTPSRNQLDRRKHGTSHTRGNIRYKLTPEQVSEIRAIGKTMTQRDIAAKYGVTWQAIGMIQRGETWKTDGHYAGYGGPSKKIRGYKRVYNRYYASIGFKGRKIILGSFKSADEAGAAYKAAQDRVRSGLHPLAS